MEVKSDLSQPRGFFRRHPRLCGRRRCRKLGLDHRSRGVPGDFGGHATGIVGLVSDRDLEWDMVQFDGVSEVHDADGVANRGQSGVGSADRLRARMRQTKAIPVVRTLEFPVDHGIFEFEITAVPGFGLFGLRLRDLDEVRPFGKHGILGERFDLGGVEAELDHVYVSNNQ